MSLYRMKSQEELYIEESCERCLDVFINTGDVALAESYVFDYDEYYLNEADDPESWNDLDDNQKRNFATKFTKSIQQYWNDFSEKKKQFEQKHPTLYKIDKTANEYRKKLISFLSEKKDWFVDKLNKISKWADECEDNSKKGTLSRVIAFIVRLIKKIANKIAELTDKIRG